MEGLSTDSIVALLACALGSGYDRIGQIGIQPGFSLCHVDDAGIAGLTEFHAPADAIELARYDDEGKYRPLKTAPNFRHGWILRLSSVEDLRTALDFIYPAALGTWLAALRGNLETTTLRATLGRQSGMYRVAGKITDAEAEGLRGTMCHAGCLRRILWEIFGEGVILHPESTGEIPLLCAEACNLFVAGAREVVKSK